MTAEELLNSLDENDPTLYSSNPETEEHIVIGIDRHITVPDQLKRIAVQYDHNIETVTFDCPRYWDGIDMSQMVIYINYMRPDNKSGSYTVQNIKVDEHDETIIHFDWTIRRHVTEAKGSLKFLVCIKTTDKKGNEENHWNSELNNEMYISEGLEFGEIVEELYPDIITQILLSLNKTDKNVTDLTGRLLALEQNKTDISDLKTSVEGIGTQVETNKTDISSLKTSVEGLSTQVETNKTDISDLKTKTDNTNTQVETNKTDISDLKTSLEGLSTQVETNKTDISNLKTKTDSTNTQVETNTTDISELSQRVTSAESAVRQLSAEQVAALNNMFAICAFTEDAATAYAAFKTVFGITE